MHLPLEHKTDKTPLEQVKEILSVHIKFTDIIPIHVTQIPKNAKCGLCNIYYSIFIDRDNNRYLVFREKPGQKPSYYKLNKV